MKNKKLSKLKKKLKNYYSYFKHPSILVVAEDKKNMPFAYVIVDEKNYKNQFLVSFAVNASSAAKASTFALEVNREQPVAVAESFYVTNTGLTKWGQEALHCYELDTYLPPLEEIEPDNKSIH